MSKNPETLENIRKVMSEIGLVDGVMFADIVAKGLHSQECKVMLGDLSEGLRSLRMSGMICSEMEEALLSEAQETVTFFNEKYCSK